MVVFGQRGCIREKVFSFRQKCLYSEKIGLVLAKDVLFGQKWLYSCKGGCNREKWLYSGKVVVFGKK